MIQTREQTLSAPLCDECHVAHAEPSKNRLPDISARVVVLPTS
jgi:hypothetical protein